MPDLYMQAHCHVGSVHYLDAVILYLIAIILHVHVAPRSINQPIISLSSPQARSVCMQSCQSCLHWLPQPMVGILQYMACRRLIWHAGKYTGHHILHVGVTKTLGLYAVMKWLCKRIQYGRGMP